MKAMRFLPTTAAMLTFLANQASGAPIAWPPNHYQGSLTESNAPASGLYEIETRIYDDGTNGNLIAIQCDGFLVANGVFTIPLDFAAANPLNGTNIFNGEPRWLELAVRRGGSSNEFTKLEPRQQIGAAPYSLFSFTAETANSVEWNDIASVPPSAITT